MHVFKQPITWIVIAVAALLGVTVGCAIANPEGTRFVVRMLLELVIYLVLWIMAIKFFFFLVDQIIGPPSE